jgi:hypothetical protein
MKASEIKVGSTYVNKGTGRTRRTVLAIGDEYRPAIWLGAEGSKPPDEPGVRFTQKGINHELYLSAFASWAGSEITGIE